MAVSRFNPDYPDAGLTLLNKTTFSGASSVSINDVFSATYKNYKIVIDLVSSGSIAVRARLRVGGADNSTANSYTSQEIRSSGATPQAVNTIIDYWQIGFSNSNPSSVEMTLFNPFVATKTGQASYGGRYDRSVLISGYHNQSTSYTGITIIAESGTITGTVRIYGYKDEV